MKEHILSLLDKKGMRPDRRSPLQYRDIKIEKGLYNNAEGSAQVEIGDTKVLAGIKMEIGEPFPDTPNKGVLISTAEFSPIAYKEFEPGPPGEEAIELARVVDRGIREAGAIDFEDLCIEEGEVVWKVFVDIYILDHNGNLLDAAALAALAALQDAKIPELKENERGEREVNYKKVKRNLEVKNYPIMTTFLKIGDHLILDPLRKEEEVAEARLSVTMTKDGYHSLQLGGSGGMKIPLINKCLDLSKEKTEFLREKIKR